MIERLCEDCGKPIKPDAKTRNKHRCLCEKNQSEAQIDSGVIQASDKPKRLLNGGVDPSVGKNTQFKPGESGNPAGKPPGTKHLSTHIQELLNDEEFETYIPDLRDGFKSFKGAPIKAILQALAIKAMAGDVKAFDALAKYGYGTKVEVDANVKGDIGLFGNDALTIKVIDARNNGQS